MHTSFVGFEIVREFLPKGTITLAKMLKAQLVTSGARQTELSKKMKVSDAYVSRIMRGEVKLSPAYLERLLEAMDISKAHRVFFHLQGATESGWQISNVCVATIEGEGYTL